jgi:hypothetical protein
MRQPVFSIVELQYAIYMETPAGQDFALCAPAGSSSLDILLYETLSPWPYNDG